MTQRRTDSPRQTKVLRDNWRFRKGDPPEVAQPDYDDSDWESVRVPHDWAISGRFDREHDLQRTVIYEDGEKKPADHVGRTGGLPHVGVAWYRRRLEIPASAARRHIFIEFDGVMSHGTVYLNGVEVGSGPYGYASFCFDLTGAAEAGGENVLAVRVDNPPCASRWYPGAGIYRHVRLVTVHPLHVGHWGTCVTTPTVSVESATVTVRTTVVNQSCKPVHAELSTRLLDPNGAEVAVKKHTLEVDEEAEVEQDFTVSLPVLWDLENRNLYTAVSEIAMGGETVDMYETPFGMRTLEFTPNDGFRLNGQRVALKGVCMHHDLGALGTAVNRRALERQIDILQQMGCNAIRTSHNPPAPELLDLCDRMGMLVIDEAFDEWKVGKVDNGYHTLFDEWAEKDLRALIRRDRNHPCVIMWSIGNEIGEQGCPDGAEVAKFLTDICHDEDPTRPVTAGFNNSEGAIENGLADVVDVAGWNYKPHWYARYHDEHPDWIMYGSETESCVSSRGEYYLPVEREKNVTRPTLHVTSYDVSSPGWGYPPDFEFAAQEDNPCMLGEFVWTGFDYLGEPTPYKTQWPSRSSYFGIVDLCGIPKDRFYLYRSRWSQEPTLHLLPHWNWEGREGRSVPVHCYTSFNQAELFLNGRSLGVRRKEKADEFRRYRLIWESVPYEAGELRVVALSDEGQAVMEQTVRTAGAASGLALSVDRQRIAADSLDLAYVTVRIVDEEGTLCPHADNEIRFSVDGPAEIAAVDNGDQTSLEPFVARKRKAFNGMCVVILRAGRESGIAKLTAEAEGLAAATVAIESREAGGADIR